MATFRDPIKCFAPLEVIERLLEIRAEFGCQQSIYVPSSTELADSLDAYGFSIYAFTDKETKFDLGVYTAPMVPGGEHSITPEKAH